MVPSTLEAMCHGSLQGRKSNMTYMAMETFGVELKLKLVLRARSFVTSRKGVRGAVPIESSKWIQAQRWQEWP